MALPSTINSATPAGSDSPALGDDQIRALKLAIEDIFGIPDATAIAAAGFAFTASGLTLVVLQDAATNPTTAGHVRRNGRRVLYHDGVAARALSTIASVDTTSVGNVGSGQDNLMTYSLGADTLNANSRGVRVTFGGRFASNGSAKVIKFFFGATEITLNAVTTSPNGVQWYGVFEIVRTSATAQRLTGTVMVGTVLQITKSTTAGETMANAITIKCTGQSLPGTTNDVIQDLMVVEILN